MTQHATREITIRMHDTACALVDVSLSSSAFYLVLKLASKPFTVSCLCLALSTLLSAVSLRLEAEQFGLQRMLLNLLAMNREGYSALKMSKIQEFLFWSFHIVFSSKRARQTAQFKTCIA